ncbi:MAG: S41 family peptidase [Bacteroidota bacterium]|nr:S41 family peptidase [Bacteroidota bacterium]
MKSKYIVIFIMCSLLFACFEDNDDTIASSTNIKDFVWKAMNAVYLYKYDVNDLTDEGFNNNQAYQNYLNSFDSPENLFEALIYDRPNIDRFSVITSNYFDLEQQLSGISSSNGAEFNFYYEPQNSTSLFGVVRLVHPYSNASDSGLERGQIFNKINGTALTAANLSSLLNNNSYSLNLATYDDNNTEDISDDDLILDTDQTVLLTKQIGFSENPIYDTSIIDLNSEKVGYLMYNGFVNEFDNELNQKFSDFQSQSIDHLVLDLRYNSGGNIRTAAALGSMITGQFDNQVFTTLKFNEDLQNNNANYNFSNTLSDGTSINSLNLTKIYILTSNVSASASEMIINSLKPYIDVVIIGDKTVGKSQASQIIYDSPNFGRQNANPGHSYALLPLIAITANKNNEEVPPSGIIPIINLLESPKNYGIIGDAEEPLLQAALSDIQGSNRLSSPETPSKQFVDFETLSPLKSLMYLETSNE